MGYYQLEHKNETQSNTYITLINSSEQEFIGGDEKTIYVYTLFFDDNEKYLKKCHVDTLSADDMVTINVGDFLKDSTTAPPQSGVFKSIAVDNNKNIATSLIGYQTKEYIVKGSTSFSETKLFVTNEKVDIKRIK
jgi:hypothetical protein